MARTLILGYGNGRDGYTWKVFTAFERERRRSMEESRVKEGKVSRNLNTKNTFSSHIHHKVSHQQKGVK